MESTLRQSLLEASRKAANETAFVPANDFPVGASILLPNGQIVTGANTEPGFAENLCGERNAIFDAVAMGAVHEFGPKFITGLVDSCVKMFGPDFHEGDGSPCGACRQVMNEFGTPDTVVYIDDGKDGIQTSIGELLPNGFYFGGEAGEKITPADLLQVECLAKNETSENLVRLSKVLSVNSWAPYTNAPSGALAVMRNGQVYGGVTVENSSTGLSAHAGVTALSRAARLSMADGIDPRGQVEKLVIYQGLSEKVGAAYPSIIPMGSLSVLGHEDTKVVIADDNHTKEFEMGAFAL